MPVALVREIMEKAIQIMPSRGGKMVEQSPNGTKFKGLKSSCSWYWEEKIVGKG
jgi:hypothetical protein